MENSWLLSTPMLLNANTSTLEMKETHIQEKLCIVIDEMTDSLEHFGKTLEQHRENSSSIISQLETCLATSLDEF